jgi:N-acetylmuramoyl-L-alanine amidase
MKYTKGILAAAILAAAAIGTSLIFASATQAQTAPQFTLLTDNQNLTVGSAGYDVVQLQGILSELGYLDIPINVQLGYFGQMTKRALAQYQASLGVPATGYFGPMTRQSMTNSFAAKGWLSLLYNTR